MTPHSWVGVLVWLGGGALSAWLVLVALFWWDAHNLRGTLQRRMTPTLKGLRAVGVLLRCYPGGKERENCLRAVASLEEALAAAMLRDQLARRSVWWSPWSATRRRSEAWASALRCEPRALALLARCERRFWRQQPVRDDAPPTDRSSTDPLQQQLVRVDELLAELLTDWNAMADELRRRTGLGGRSPEALQNEARAAMAQPGGRPKAWMALADAAWLCVVASTWGRQQAAIFHLLQERSAYELREAQKQGVSAHQAPPFAHEEGFEARLAASRRADELMAEGGRWLELFAWKRAEHALLQAKEQYIHSNGRGYVPVNRRPAAASDHRLVASLFDEEGETAELELESSDLWGSPESFSASLHGANGAPGAGAVGDLGSLDSAPSLDTGASLDHTVSLGDSSFDHGSSGGSMMSD